MNLLESEAMDEDLVDTDDVPTVGERLRAAREEKGLSLDDVAAQTRIPHRHLASIEKGDWELLPAPTYTTGFAKSYATAVGLDRTEIGDQLRAEMGGQRFTANTAEIFEPADPRRTMPKWLVLGTIGAVILLVAVMSWLNQRSLQPPDDSATLPTAANAPAEAPAPQPAAPSAEGQPVVLTATDAVWLQVSEKGGATLFSGMLQPGQTYAVPASASAPVLKTGKPEALRINVGGQIAPQVGAASTTVRDVSLLGPDLIKAGSTAPGAATNPPSPAPQSAAPTGSRQRATASKADPAPAATETPLATTNSE
jgi:cytoskeletal protein RodZ